MAVDLEVEADSAEMAEALEAEKLLKDGKY